MAELVNAYLPRRVRGSGSHAGYADGALGFLDHGGCTRELRTRLVNGAGSARTADETQRQQRHEWHAALAGRPPVALEPSRIAARLRGRRVALLAAGATSARALPAHRRSVRTEAVAMAEETTGDHDATISPRLDRRPRGAGRTSP